MEKDDEKKPKNKYEHLDADKKEQAEKSVTKLEAIRAAKELDNPDSEWSKIQEIAQEIVATYIIEDPESRPGATIVEKKLKEEIETRYKEDPETKKVLLEAVPSSRSIRKWFNKKGWEEAVWSKIRMGGLFTSTKRAQMIEAIRQRGMKKSDVAAKMWLTMSGDYSEKDDQASDKTADLFREINKVIHNKNPNNSSNTPKSS